MTARAAFEALRSQDMRNERRIFWSEVAIIAICAMLTTAYIVALGLAHPGIAPKWLPVSSVISQFAIGPAVSAVRYPLIHSAETAKPWLRP